MIRPIHAQIQTQFRTKPVNKNQSCSFKAHLDASTIIDGPLYASLNHDLTVRFRQIIRALAEALEKRSEDKTLILRDMPPYEGKKMMVGTGSFHQGELLVAATPRYGGGPIHAIGSEICVEAVEDLQLQVGDRRLGFCSNLEGQRPDETLKNLLKTYEYLID